MSKKHKQEKEKQPGSLETEGSEHPASQVPSEGGAGEAALKEEARGQSLEDQLAAAREEARKHWDLYLRERADLENFRKRAQRDKEETIRFANERILREILPVLDNLERAVEHARQEPTDNGGLMEGVKMTLGQLQKAVEKFGVRPVAAIGQPFDPKWHEAMGMVESDQPANTVVQEFQKGYLLHDRLLRPALVMLSKAQAENEEPPSGND